MPRKSAQGRRDGVFDADGAGGLWGGGGANLLKMLCFCFCFANSLFCTLSLLLAKVTTKKSGERKR